jgi:probable phosphoglycerate mutase
MLRVLLTRHGQSAWNAEGRWQGQADPPLSELGRAQARAAGTIVGSFDAVIASDLERACATAQIIAEGTGIGPVLVDARLRERNAGEFQGLTRPEIEERFPGYLASETWPPSWEPDASLLDRALDALDDIAARVGTGDVLVVAHAGIIYALEDHFDVPFERIPNLWLIHDGRRWALGERAPLVPDDVTVEIPDLL